MARESLAIKDEKEGTEMQAIAWRKPECESDGYLESNTLDCDLANERIR